MRRFIEEADRGQSTLLPDDFIDESNPVRVIDAFVEALDGSTVRIPMISPGCTDLISPSIPR